MNSHRIIATAAALALAVTPAALAKKGSESNAKGKEKSALKGQNGKGKGKNKAKTVVVKGTVVSADAATVIVNVTKGNRRGRDYLGEVTFTLADAKLSVADSNADGVVDGTDLLVGDKVVVQAKLPARAEGDLSYPARKVVDQTNPAEDDDEVETPEVVEPAPVTPAV